MRYRPMAAIQALTGRTGSRERGQGTVEYVALILLVAVILAGVLAATKQAHIGGSDIAEAIVKQIRKALDEVS